MNFLFNFHISMNWFKGIFSFLDKFYSQKTYNLYFIMDSKKIYQTIKVFLEKN